MLKQGQSQGNWDDWSIYYTVLFVENASKTGKPKWQIEYAGQRANFFFQLKCSLLKNLPS